MALDAAPWLGLALFAAGTLLGFFAGWAARARNADLEELRSRRLIEENERRRQAETEALLDGVKLAFLDIGQDLMRRGADQAVELAGQRLDAERRVDGERRALEENAFENSAANVLGQLDKLFALVREVEAARGRAMGELSAEIERAGVDARALAEATRRLEATLSNRSARGQWGERMADDLLAKIGLQEGVHFVKQRALANGARPDVTLLLGDGLEMHMDVKFPLDNLLRSLEAEGGAEAKRFGAAFAKDLRKRIGEVAERGYADQGGFGCALLLAPSERFAQAMFERDPEAIDFALRKNVILCSPTTLFAVLAVIRACASRFRLDRDAETVARAIRDFTEAWRGFERDAKALATRLDGAASLANALARRRGSKVARAIETIEALDQFAPTSSGKGESATGQSLGAGSQDARSIVTAPQGVSASIDEGQ